MQLSAGCPGVLVLPSVSRGHLLRLGSLWPSLDGLWSEHLKQITTRQAENGVRTQWTKFKEVSTLGVTYVLL